VVSPDNSLLVWLRKKREQEDNAAESLQVPSSTQFFASILPDMLTEEDREAMSGVRNRIAAGPAAEATEAPSVVVDLLTQQSSLSPMNPGIVSEQQVVELIGKNPQLASLIEEHVVEPHMQVPVILDREERDRNSICIKQPLYMRKVRLGFTFSVFLSGFVFFADDDFRPGAR
jgi:hypothetical protein